VILMMQKIEKINGYRYITTTFKFSEDKDRLESIINEASRLSGVVSPYDPGGNFRPFTVRLSKNTGGLLAEEAFKIYVEDLIKTKRLNAKIVRVGALKEEVIEEIGTQIDFVLEVNGKEKSVEVRSSFSYKTNFPRLFGIPLINGKGAFSIIGWYEHQHKPPEEKKDYYIFDIHFYAPAKIREKCKNEVTVYIAGAASKMTLETKGYDDSLKQRGAKFRVVNPLISVPDPISVIDEILEIDS
jgi:hypothetical protein